MLIEDRIDLLVDGSNRPAAGNQTIDVLDPATGDRLAQVAAAQQEDVQAAIDAARRAQPAWAALPPRERGQVLYRIAQGIRADAEHLALVESSDTGKPLRQAKADVEVAAQYFEFYAGYADKLYGDTIPLNGSSFALTFREPLGVTGHIIPWNYPIQIGSRTIAPSLMVGNACVVKPAEEAPLAAVLVARIALEAGLPAGVLNIVPGLGEVAGAYLAASDDIDHISFTGGLDTGRLVMAAAARNVKPVTMELGGKSPSIVLADADLARAVPVITNALVQNAGQTCAAGTRVIVHESRHDELVELLGQRFRDVRVGRGSDDPDMGPLISAVQRDRVLGYVDVARDEGCTVVAGGGAPALDGLSGGFFVAPTLLDGVTSDMRVAREEIFGPVLSVLSFGEETEAATIADATPFGLVTSVWTSDVDRALWLARHVKSGQVYVNSYGAGGGVPLPFGGFKKSGFGREKGLEAVLEYSHTKMVAFDVREQA